MIMITSCRYVHANFLQGQRMRPESGTVTGVS
jgi:hypothetical protein